MRERGAIGWPAILVSGAGVVALMQWWPGPAALAVAAAYVVSYVVVVPTGSGLGVSLAPAVAGGAFLTSGGSAVLVLASGAVVLPIAVRVARFRHGDPVAQHLLPAEAWGVAALVAVAGPTKALMSGSDAVGGWELAVFGAAAVVAAIVTTLSRGAGSILSRRQVVMRGVADWPAHGVLYSTAALFSVTVDPMGWWSVAVAGVPYAFSHLALVRLQATRHTYDQTIRALGAIPEVADHVPTGHLASTAELAVAIGVETGMGPAAVSTLERAALLHDLGRVVLSNPAVAADRSSFADVSQWSAAIVGEVRHLEDVAAVVAAQHAPYRREGEVRDPAVPVASQIVRVAARYDTAIGDGIDPRDAIEVLHAGAAYDYDPEVVMALRRVLERRGVLLD